MALLADRVKETTTTTGTGNVTLAGAASGFRTFNSGFGVGPRFYYVILDANGTAWETGEGYLSASTTLVRELVRASSNSGSAVNLSAGTHTVFCTYIAEQYADRIGGVEARRLGWLLP